MCCVCYLLALAVGAPARARAPRLLVFRLPARLRELSTITNCLLFNWAVWANSGPAPVLAVFKLATPRDGQIGPAQWRPGRPEIQQAGKPARQGRRLARWWWRESVGANDRRPADDEKLLPTGWMAREHCGRKQLDSSFVCLFVSAGQWPGRLWRPSGRDYQLSGRARGRTRTCGARAPPEVARGRPSVARALCVTSGPARAVTLRRALLDHGHCVRCRRAAGHNADCVCRRAAGPGQRPDNNAGRRQSARECATNCQRLGAASGPLVSQRIRPKAPLGPPDRRRDRTTHNPLGLIGSSIVVGAAA